MSPSDFLLRAFGDLFLRDIRDYRESLIGRIGMRCAFPLWGRDTKTLAEQFVDAGFKAVICTVNPGLLAPRFCGKEFDRALPSELPETMDPCGENGEFHTFVCDGPIFKRRVEVRVGQIAERDGFYFADLAPSRASSGSR